MSYCRFSPGSDLYIFASAPAIFCVTCRLFAEQGHDGSDYVAESPAEMLLHVREHVAAGHKVWEGAIERLERECADEANQ